MFEEKLENTVGEKSIFFELSTFLALLIFTVIASEGRVGLAFLLKARRQFSPEMEKRRV